jgi:phosphoenolpyruvate carboxykinase (ATP)
MSVPSLVKKALDKKKDADRDRALLVTTGNIPAVHPTTSLLLTSLPRIDVIDWGKVNVPIQWPDSIPLQENNGISQGREIFIFDGFAGADPKYRLPIRVVNELASQNLFKHSFCTSARLSGSFVPASQNMRPGFKCFPAVDGTNSEAAYY